MDLDKLDNCGEVTLGLLATFGCTLVVWMVALPFFDLITMGWVRSWERHTGFISMADFKDDLFLDRSDRGPAEVKKFFTSMDKTEDGFVDISELRDFLGDLKKPINKDEQVNFIFQGLDENGDDVVTSEEWNTGLAKPEFFYWESTTTTTTTAAAEGAAAQVAAAQIREKAEAAVQEAAAKEAAKGAAAQAAAEQRAKEAAERAERGRAKLEKPPQPPAWKDEVSMEELISRMGDAGKGTPEHALRGFDIDQDSMAAHEEFIKGLGKLPRPVSGPAAEGIFKNLDLNQDNVVESQEFANAFNQKKYVKKVPPGEAHVQFPHSSQRKQEVLEEMGLSEPPLKMAQFSQGMGKASPATAFKALDADQNGEISEDEMVRFSKAFMPPLTEKQARYAQKGLDVNGDRRVVPAEMYDTLKFGDFFPTESQARSTQ